MYIPTNLNNKSRKELKAEIVEALSHSDMSKTELIKLYIKLTCKHTFIVTVYGVGKHKTTERTFCKLCDKEL